jgi:hypothetical protein
MSTSMQINIHFITNGTEDCRLSPVSIGRLCNQPDVGIVCSYLDQDSMEKICQSVPRDSNPTYAPWDILGLSSGIKHS